jgi:hypothetical protein
MLSVSSSLTTGRKLAFLVAALILHHVRSFSIVPLHALQQRGLPFSSFANERLYLSSEENGSSDNRADDVNEGIDLSLDPRLYNVRLSRAPGE